MKRSLAPDFEQTTTSSSVLLGLVLWAPSSWHRALGAQTRATTARPASPHHPLSPRIIKCWQSCVNASFFMLPPWSGSYLQPHQNFTTFSKTPVSPIFPLLPREDGDPGSADPSTTTRWGRKDAGPAQQPAAGISPAISKLVKTSIRQHGLSVNMAHCKKLQGPLQGIGAFFPSVCQRITTKYSHLVCVVWIMNNLYHFCFVQ